METRSWLTRILRNLTISPYGWRYTLQLPFYALRPGVKNHSAMAKASRYYRTDTYTEKSMTLVLAGDIMQLNDNVIPTLSPELITLIARADYFIANCEAPIVAQSVKKKHLWNFAMPVDYLEAILSQLPLANERCILSVANNHSRDEVTPIFQKGLQLLTERLGVTVVGATPYTMVQHSSGCKFAFCAWTQLMNGERYLSPQRVVNRAAESEKIDWQQFKQEAGIDCLIGLPHWDREYQCFPQPETRATAKKLIAQGFDFLIGSHPHVPQPLELIGDALCCYSMGNFCTQDWHSLTRLIPIIEVDLSQTGTLCGYRVHFFTQCHDNGVHVRPLDRHDKRQKVIKRLYRSANH